jgi:F-type H+-transporting ATPase subunit b
MGALGNLGINIGYLLMQIFIFTILFLVLRHFLYSPIMNTLESRKERIAKGLEDARQAAIARDKADAEAKKILDAARAEAAKIRQEATQQAEDTRKGIVAEAEREARAKVEAGREDAEEERNRILSDLRDQVAAISIAAANKLVGDALDEKRQRTLIQEFFAKVPEGVAGMRGETAEVTSALPLTEAEKQKVQEMLRISTVKYKVNPNILGGLIVRVGDEIVDNSVSGQMNALRETLR